MEWSQSGNWNTQYNFFCPSFFQSSLQPPNFQQAPNSIQKSKRFTTPQPQHTTSQKGKIKVQKHKRRQPVDLGLSQPESHHSAPYSTRSYTGLGLTYCKLAWGWRMICFLHFHTYLFVPGHLRNRGISSIKSLHPVWPGLGKSALSKPGDVAKHCMYPVSSPRLYLVSSPSTLSLVDSPSHNLPSIKPLQPTSYPHQLSKNQRQVPTIKRRTSTNPTSTQGPWLSVDFSASPFQTLTSPVP